MVEAFVTEHRNSQYINAQLLSCRAALDVANPFADRELFILATRIPMSAKIHNALNRAMLRKHAPDLLRFPMGATLVAARAPLLAQEASRLLRKGVASVRWTLHFASGGRLAPPGLSWVNFEFLRSGRSLHALTDDLECPIWNREAIRERIRRSATGDRQRPMHGLSDQLLKVYTLDLLLRR